LRMRWRRVLTTSVCLASAVRRLVACRLCVVGLSPVRERLWEQTRNASSAFARAPPLPVSRVSCPPRTRVFSCSPARVCTCARQRCARSSAQRRCARSERRLQRSPLQPLTQHSSSHAGHCGPRADAERQPVRALAASFFPRRSCFRALMPRLSGAQDGHVSLAAHHRHLGEHHRVRWPRCMCRRRCSDAAAWPL
jgi:hypothetical protein